MTTREALLLALRYLDKRRIKIYKTINEDYSSFEIIGEYIHYKTEEGFEKAKKEEAELNEAIHELTKLNNDMAIDELMKEINKTNDKTE